MRANVPFLKVVIYMLLHPMVDASDNLGKDHLVSAIVSYEMLIQILLCFDYIIQAFL